MKILDLPEFFLSGNYNKKYMAFKSTHKIIFCTVIMFINLSLPDKYPMITIYPLYRNKVMEGSIVWG